MSKICLSVAEASCEKMLTIIMSERANYNLVELRVDALKVLEEAPLIELCQKLLAEKIPFIWTLRWAKENGQFKGSEEEREDWLRFGDEHGASFIDVEAFSAIAARFKPKKAKLILSHHNFESLPSELSSLLNTVASMKSDVIKFAFACESTSDLRRVFELYVENKKISNTPLIAIAMGEWGEASRVLSAKLGLPWTYACSGVAEGTAPGQLCARELKHLYRLDQVDEDTEFYTVIGDPVAHSLSPKLHNGLYAQLGINALYGKIHVDDMDEFYKITEILNIKGASVTVPHKEKLMKWVQEDDGLKEIGAANTLIKNGESWKIANTDIQGAMSAIECFLGDMTAPKILMLGAGGAARGLSWGMSQAGWQMTICNRSQDKAEKLAAEVAGDWLHWDDRNAHGYDVIINSTSMGMEPHEDISPLEFEGGHTGLIVFDVVYTPEMTLFLKNAKAAGAMIITGREMFFRQAAAQHFAWFGDYVPNDEMQKILEEIN